MFVFSINGDKNNNNNKTTIKTSMQTKEEVEKISNNQATAAASVFYFTVIANIFQPIFFLSLLKGQHPTTTTHKI